MIWNRPMKHVLRWRSVSLAAILSTWLAASPARADEPVGPEVDAPRLDCSQPGPGRVPLVINKRDERVFIQPKSRWRQGHEVWLGTRCLPAAGERLIQCRGPCTLYVHPGSYAGFEVGPTGATLMPKGNDVVFGTGLVLTTGALVTALVTTFVVALKSPDIDRWDSPYAVTLLASAGALVSGVVMVAVGQPRYGVKPLLSAVAAPRPTFSFAPVPGGGLVSWTIHF